MRRGTSVWSLTAGLTFAALATLPTAVTASDESPISAEAQKVVDYLVDDWNQQFRSTSVPLAMSNLEMKPDDVLRLEIAEYLRANTGLAKNLEWWGVNNYILSNDEKLIAKLLLNTYRDQKRLPTRTEVAQTVALPVEEATERLRFLAQAGLLDESSETELGFALAEGYRSWGGPLRYNYHTVSIEGQQPFDVW